MKCIIGLKKIKYWSKALLTLIQTGDSVFSFIITPTSLTISSLDPSALSHIKFSFEAEFFTDYTFLEQVEEISFKVPVKCILKPFRSQRSLKNVSHIELKVVNNSNKLVITSHKKWGGKVNYSILFTSDEENYVIDCEPSSLKSCVRADPKLICNGLKNFSRGKGVSHIVLRATKDLISMKNTVTELVKSDGKVFTEICLNSLDFHEYNVAENIEITFAMREFKSFIQFCEAVKLPISIHFESPQKPLILYVVSEDYYESTMTLAAKEVANVEFTSQSTNTEQSIKSVASAAKSRNKRSGRVGKKTNREPETFRNSRPPRANEFSVPLSGQASEAVPLFRLPSVSNVPKDPSQNGELPSTSNGHANDNTNIGELVENLSEKRNKLQKKRKRFNLDSLFSDIEATGQYKVIVPASDSDSDL